ncbi:MAG: polysaccharide biosynthesis protein PslH, partial [Solirubrobacteraceae bacterium]|nr:polysaccharide biosynthesis protein PslH [Solirubrobacteraceae bacterium]
MRILILVTRYPRPHTKGDQQRAFSWIGELSQRHDVCVVTSAPAPPSRGLPEGVRLICAPAGALARAGSAIAAAATGAPLQVGWMMPRRSWRAATRAMVDADVALAMTTRSLRGPASCPLVIDHVDALSLNMARR